MMTVQRKQSEENTASTAAFVIRKMPVRESISGPSSLCTKP